MEKIFRKDINTKKVFKRGNTTYYQVYADRERHLYVYDIIRTEDGQHRGYEIIKAPQYKNPDGSVIDRMISDEEFGTYGWATMGTENTYGRETEQILNKAFHNVFKNAHDCLAV